MEWQFYPKSGTANPIPALHVVSSDGRPLGSQGLEADGYIVPGFSWTADSRSVAYRTLLDHDRWYRRQARRLFHLEDRPSNEPVTEGDAGTVNATSSSRRSRAFTSTKAMVCRRLMMRSISPSGVR